MINWIRSLFCDHKWQCVQQGPCRIYDVDEGMWFSNGHYKDYICQKCLSKKRVKWG